ncbi:MAG: heparinase II/III-family protein [Candidatus Pacebacteria bacterium]|nr:heparinase II/III-family protein [Candidatus Paceibacterota bacterium]
MKEHSAFYPRPLIENVRRNIGGQEWGEELRDAVVEAAKPWAQRDDEALWNLMFGPTISRSWMVWSNGHCPACGKPVPMYNWEIDALQRPWKVRCPHCGEIFPKNDFHAFYTSGLDEHSVFAPARADRSLLVNAEHPDPDDPLHKFGVDDGEGYVEGNNRWRFIGAYLIYGQWKQAILGGIKKLAAAYVLTGERRYAHKAAVMLDRVADLYPMFDFKNQGLVYETSGHAGYVSTWHDACEETRELALAYDRIYAGIEGDEELVRFLQTKAERFTPANPKNSIAEIRANIENRILRDALANQHKIHSNYPRKEIAAAVMKAILEWPDNRHEVLGIINGFMQRATAVDGVTGEKGLANYSAFGLQSIALFLAEWDRAIPGFLDEIYKRCPRLHDMYRFHIDTWCLGSYYPLSGDTGWFAKKIDRYQGVRFRRFGLEDDYSHQDGVLAPSMYTFMWRLYDLTKDPAFAQVLYLANDRTAEGLPHDLFIADPKPIRGGIHKVVAEEGEYPALGCVNKQEWHLAILRSGKGEDKRAAWLDYDSGGAHYHKDGMNLGLFARGLDLMPEFGYPPVQFGGWGSPKARWYTMTAAHNTVVVDGKDQSPVNGRTTLWAEGKRFQCVRASAPKMIGGLQYERTVATVGLPGGGFYVLDIFRVVGGRDHAKFFHSHFGRVSTTGLTLEDSEPYGHATQMRNFRVDPAAKPGWHADWDIEDRYGILSEGTPLGVRYTDLTATAQAGTAKAWISYGGYGADITKQAWIPRLMVRRQSTSAPLASTFAAVIEPYGDRPRINAIRRLPLTDTGGVPCPDTNVAVEVTFDNGSSDLLVAADVENPLGLTPCPGMSGKALVQPDWRVQVNGELCMIRRNAGGDVTRIALCKGTSVNVDKLVLDLSGKPEFFEIVSGAEGWRVVAGPAEALQRIGDTEPLW